MIIGATVLSLSVTFNAPKTEAGIWDLVNGAIFVLGNAHGAREQILDLGNDPYNQNALYNDRKDDKGRKNDSKDTRAIKLANDVMNKLVKDGKYYIRSNSLPFRWRVTGNKEFNASCYYTDFISINEGIIKQTYYNPDLLAAVLGHEMTHGLKQHVANDNYAKSLMKGGIYFAGNAMSNNGWGIGAGVGVQLLQFLSVKNIDVPSELEADREGFFILSSAGFNPGGTCALMYRMNEFSARPDQVADFFQPISHPATPRRLNDAEKLLFNYGMGHCTVKNTDSIYLDDKFLLKAEAEDDLKSAEKAYLIAGGIAKAFHDYETIDGWNFRQGEDSSLEFLDDNPVYTHLKQAIKRLNIANEFKERVSNAYITDGKKNKRNKFMKEELSYYKGIEDRKAKEMKETKLLGDKIRNGNAYINMRLTDLAEKEYRRAEEMDKKNPSVKSGKALVASQRGQYEEAMRLANEAIKMDPTLGSSYTAKAMICLEHADRDNALLACQDALRAKTMDKYAHKIAGDIYDANENHAEALAEYQAYKDSLQKELEAAKMEVPTDIPEAYRSELR